MNISISSNGEIKQQRSVFIPDSEWAMLKEESRRLSKLLSKKVSLSQTLRLKIFYTDELLFVLEKRWRSK